MNRQSKKKVASVSWADGELWAKAKARAENLGLSLSGYINQLVVRDLKDGGDFVIQVKSKRKVQS